MHDITPDISFKWRFIEDILANTARNYGYLEIRTPILENSNLFCRSIGQETDIVNKEMYTFSDRNGDSVTMRPEGTASCVRAMLQTGLLRSAGQKIWYQGPMFRYERPQKGRTRQFHQFGLEAFGISSADIESEMLSYCDNVWQQLGIKDKLTLEINSLGTGECRTRYRSALVEFFSKHTDKLTEEEQIRLKNNPLRILDSKNPLIKELINNAPVLNDYISNEEKEKFNKLKAHLDAMNIKYKLNPYLVRGLDYYNGTVFEWTTTELGAQGTVCAGGRYDNLVGTLSTNGTSTPAFGFAMGLERILELVDVKDEQLSHIYLVAVDDGLDSHIWQLAHKLRTSLNLVVNVDLISSNIKNKFKRAANNKAKVVIILGSDELESGSYTIKFMDSGEQKSINSDKLLDVLKNYFGV
jgi:histidyl-tRNA synthetase